MSRPRSKARAPEPPEALRWLARRVLPEAPAGDLPAPERVSHLWRTRERAVVEYVSRWATNPDPAGAFAARTRWLRFLPSPWFGSLLLALRYEGLLYRAGPSILGHVFHQQHGSALHIFSASLSEDLSGRGLSFVMLLDCVALAQISGFRRVRLGRGTNLYCGRLLARLQPHAADLGWRLDTGGAWIDFAP